MLNGPTGAVPALRTVTDTVMGWPVRAVAGPATAEISRSQLWQWRTTATKLADGREASADLYAAVRDEELARLGGPTAGYLGAAAFSPSLNLM